MLQFATNVNNVDSPNSSPLLNSGCTGAMSTLGALKKVTMYVDNAWHNTDDEAPPHCARPSPRLCRRVPRPPNWSTFTPETVKRDGVRCDISGAVANGKPQRKFRHVSWHDDCRRSHGGRRPAGRLRPGRSGPVQRHHWGERFPGLGARRG